jgi:hypothetical protein
MIINSIADFQVENDKLVSIPRERPIKYEIKGSSSTLTGEVPAKHFRVVDAKATGKPPYTVVLGYINDSYVAAPVVVDTDDTLLCFSMGFPAGPNRPQTFVYKPL